MTFIAAMDNSGGSAGGVLDLYGQEWSEEDKMEKINNFRMRMLKCMNNDSRQIDTAIMYKDSVERGMVDELKARGIEPFLKVDQGVEENGTLKIFPVHEICEWAVEKGCTGTKMRSIVKDDVFRLRDPRKTRVLLCFGRRKPAPECSLVAQRHVFYGFSEAILGFRDDLRKPLYFTLKLGPL